MYDRELGCKTIGCFLAVILVMGFFAYLMNVAQGMADRQRDEQAAVPVTAPAVPAASVPGVPSLHPRPHAPDDDQADITNIARLPALLQAARAYAADHAGRLPPMDTPAAFRAAVAPRYASSPDVFQSPRTKTPYIPNPDLSGKPLKSISEPAAVVAFYEPLPETGAGAAKPRAMITIGGTLRTVTPEDWARLWGHRNSPRRP